MSDEPARGGGSGDPRWAEGEPRLLAALRAEIAASPENRITFARFMSRALTEPGLGYYATSAQRPTRAGDFLTAPELHPFFGRCMGRQLDEVWQRLGEPSRFVVREWGAGSGTLSESVLAGLRADRSGLVDALEWQPVDLPGRHAVVEGPVVGAIVANEYLDALPVHRVSQRDGMLVERYVTWRDGYLAEEDGPPSTQRLAAHLGADGVTLADDQIAEVCLAAPEWVAVAAGVLERGLLLIIDYGHTANELYGPLRMAGTLLTYRGQTAGTDPFAAVGRQDLTAHVDITAIERAAAQAGLSCAVSTTQARFLAALRLGDLLSDLGRRADGDAQAYLDARASVLRLLDPRHLGAFRVLGFSRALPGVPPLRGSGSPGPGKAMA